MHVACRRGCRSDFSREWNPGSRLKSLLQPLLHVAIKSPAFDGGANDSFYY